jgi:hypothetical protein
MSNEKKYVCPMDLFGGKIRKGDLYHSKGSKLFMHPVKQKSYETGMYTVPYEIAITWEEYKEVKEPIRCTELERELEKIPQEVRDKKYKEWLNDVKDYLDETFPKEIDSWCVKVTQENINVVERWYRKDLLQFISIDESFVGIDIDGKINGKEGDVLKLFDKVISTEEFYQKIGYNQEIKEPEKGAIRYSIGGIYERFDGEKWTSNFNTEITDADLVVGKTVLIHKKRQSEHLILAKEDELYLLAKVSSILHQYSLKQINEFYTIKQ